MQNRLFFYMKIYFLGTGSATITSQRNASCIFIETLAGGCLLDCGEGAQMQMRKQHIKLSKLKHCFISHLHGDHIFGLIGLLSSLSLFGRKEPLHIYSFSELSEIIDIQLRITNTILKYPLIYHTLNNRQCEIILNDNYLEVQAFPLQHGIPTCGFKLVERIPATSKKAASNKSLSYCCDTICDSSYSSYIQNSDILIHESTYLNAYAHLAHERFHSTAIEVAQLAKASYIQDLYLTHFSARFKNIIDFAIEAQTIFPNSYAAQDNMIVYL